MEEAGGKVVCVTGASGYIASWLVKLLLDRDYTVRATVRSLKKGKSFTGSPVLMLLSTTKIISTLKNLLDEDLKKKQHLELCHDDPKKIDHLLSLEGAKDRLQFFEANLLEEGSFDAAIDGCDGVFHTACPVIISEIKNPQEEMIDPSVKGTANVLKSCLKSPSVRRVIMTSSMASVFFNDKPLTADVVIDETWFSDPAYCEANKIYYPLSKTLADDVAYKFAKEHGIDLITLHPGLVFGPLLQPSINFSSEGFLDLIKYGKDVFPGGFIQSVDVRDVANAHIRALETPSANGRYCLVGRVTHSSEVLKILNELYPNLDLPIRSESDYEKAVNGLFKISKQKAESIGMKFTPLEVTLKDTFEDLKVKNLLTF